MVDDGFKETDDGDHSRKLYTADRKRRRGSAAREMERRSKTRNKSRRAVPAASAADKMRTRRGQANGVQGRNCTGMTTYRSPAASRKGSVSKGVGGKRSDFEKVPGVPAVPAIGDGCNLVHTTFL